MSSPRRSPPNATAGSRSQRSLRLPRVKADTPVDSHQREYAVGLSFLSTANRAVASPHLTPGAGQLGGSTALNPAERSLTTNPCGVGPSPVAGNDLSKPKAAAVAKGQHDRSSDSLPPGLNVVLERGAYAGCENRQVGQVVVGEQGYRELTVVGQRGDAQPHAGDERC
jgi:hypothetical protein